MSKPTTTALPASDLPAVTPAARLLGSPTPAPEGVRSTLSDLLAPLVANGIALTLCAQTAHWNVRGKSFGPLHALFGSVYDELSEIVDTLAERIATLGGNVPGSLSEVAILTMSPRVIEPYPVKVTEGFAHVAALADRVQSYCAAISVVYRRAEEAGDVATVNALANAQEAVEKLGWKLRAHLE